MLTLFVDETTPFLDLDLDCRFHPDCSDKAALLVEYAHGCVCFPDRLQALCLQHAQRGLDNNRDGRVIAFIVGPQTPGNG